MSKDNTLKNSEIPPKPSDSKTWGEWWKDSVHFWSHILDLREGLDRKGTLLSIQKNIETKGANVWLLICAICIASIGLNVNSPAVIIGAMLISPLMSPILGIGLSIGINDKKTLWASIRHFLIAIVVSLITSSFYFLVTPFEGLTSEMAARTSPTILDVLVAFFGGIAGIVAGSRKDLINAVPGVAIATALLPPLCVTGYGLANFEWEIAWGSFYLFFLNSTFVSLATYIIVRVLRYPYKQYINRKEARRTKFIIAASASLLVIPSFLKLFEILGDLREKQQITQYVESEFNTDELQALKWDFTKTDSTSNLKVVVVGDYIAPEEIPQYQAKLYENAPNCNLELVQMEEEPPNFDAQTENLKADILARMEAMNQIRDEKDKEILALQQQVNKVKNNSIPLLDLQKELKILFPSLEKFSISKVPQADFGTKIDSINLLLLKWDKSNLTPEVQTAKETQLQDWLQAKLELNNIQVVEY